MRHTISAPRAGLGAEYAASPQARRVLRNTYLLLGITMLPTIAGAFVGAMFPLMERLGWMSLIIFMGAMFGLQAMVIRNRDSMAGVGWLLVFTFVMGYFTGPLVGFALGSFSNGAELVALAIGGTAAIFMGLAGYATVTTRDFAGMSLGKTLFIGMWMAFALGVLNFFLQVPALSLAISAACFRGLRGHRLRLYSLHRQPHCARRREQLHSRGDDHLHHAAEFVSVAAAPADGFRRKPGVIFASI